MNVIPGIYSLGGRAGAYVRAFVLEQIEVLGRSVSDVKHILLTHGHRSHLGGLAKLAELSGAPVYAHECEADIIAGQRAAQSVSWLPHTPLRSYPYQVGNNLNILKHKPWAPDHTIHEGDQIGRRSFAPRISLHR